MMMMMLVLCSLLMTVGLVWWVVWKAVGAELVAAIATVATELEQNGVSRVTCFLGIWSTVFRDKCLNLTHTTNN